MTLTKKFFFWTDIIIHENKGEGGHITKWWKNENFWPDRNFWPMGWPGTKI